MSTTARPSLLPAPPPPPPGTLAVTPRRGQVIRRGLRIIGVALRFGYYWWLDQQDWSYNRGESREQREVRRARWLREHLVALGPTFIKIGQALSTRVDLLPRTYVDEMAELQDRIPGFPTSLARQFIEQELGAPVESVFKNFPDAPIAAASLGQVYHTWLHDGTEVAVKVQRPNLLEIFAVDLTVLRHLASWAEQRVDWLRTVQLLDILDEFGRKLHEEVDYIREADNADRFRENFAGYPGISVPLMYRRWSSHRVLTMEFMHGTKVSNEDVLKSYGIAVPEMVRHVFQINLKQLLEDGYFHADLHPGNILIDREGRVIFIDFGLMGEITRSMRAQMVEAFFHIVDRDIDKLMEDMVLLDFIRPGQDVGPLKPTVGWVIDQSLQPMGKRPTFREMTMPLSQIFYEYHLRVPVNFSWIIRTVLALEGLAMILDPSFHPFDVAIPFAAKMLLSESGQDIRDRFVDEIFTPEGLNWDRLFELIDLARLDPGFKMGQVADLGVEWLVSKEGRYVRDKALDEFLGNEPIPWSKIEKLIDLLQEDPSFDLMAMARPMINFLLSPEGRPFQQRLAWKIGKDLLTGRIGDWTGIYKVVRAIL